MKHLVYQLMAAYFLLTACNGGKTTGLRLETIPLGAAFDHQTELKASDCFRKTRYIALETTEDCLVGKEAHATLLNDWIVVTSEKDRCQLFDKKTGRFIRSVGHIGQDPESYSSVQGGWQNPYTCQLTFNGWENKRVVYGADGKFSHTWTPPIPANPFPATTTFDYLDADLTVGYYSAIDSLPARLTLFRGTETVRVDPLPSGQKGDATIVPDDIASISVSKDVGDNMDIIYLRYTDNKSAAFPIGNSYFWHKDKELYFHQPYNDTIYQVSAEKGLQPVRVLDLGAHGWQYDERFEDKKDAIYPTQFMETEAVILFHFLTNLYNDKREIYNALYRKADGTVKVSLFHDKITDDLNGFLPLQPVSVSPAGEFVALLPADEVVDWFEQHPNKTDLPADIAALRKVGEEDNPVVVIME